MTSMQASPAASSLLNQVTAEGHRILQYWRDHVILPDGSFHGEVAADGAVRSDAPRSLILATRILWTYSRAITSGFADTAEHRKIADGAYEFLVRNYWDPIHLGFYWLIDRNNMPVQDFKHVYGQSFAMYSLAEYFAASGRNEALKLAQLTYKLVEQKAADVEHGGYFEAFTLSWARELDLHQAPVNHGGPKSMNTHLHILEAYTRLYQVWRSPELRARLTDVLDVMMQRVVNSDTSHFHLFFQGDWAVTGDVISYGHDIEGSWLMLEAAEALADEERIQACRKLAVRMVDAVLAEGVDADHGVMNEGRGRDIIDSDVHWWPQAEAIVGCVNAFQVTNNIRYLEEASNMWKFVEQYMLDRQNGEWFHKVPSNRAIDSPASKVSAWKCPYHNTRACIEVYQRLGKNA